MGRRADAVFVACFALLTLIVFQSLLPVISSRLPVDAVDPLFNAWVMAYNGRTILQAPADIFSANIFHPYPYPLAYSDLMLVASVAALPVNLLFGNAIAAYNFVLLLTFVFSAFAMFLVVRLLTGRPLVALVGGAAYSFSVYRVSQMGHLQLLTDGLLVMAIFFAHRWLLSGRSADIVLAGAFVGLQAVTAWYYGFYALMLLVVFCLFFLAAGVVPINRRTAGQLAAAGAVIGLTVAPFAVPYLRLQKLLPGFGRTLSESVFFSADASDYVSSLNPIFVAVFRAPWNPVGVGKWEHFLFPGFFAASFALIGLALTFAPRARPQEKVARYKIKLFYFLVAAGAFVLSFGPYLTAGNRMIALPYYYLWNWIPGFKAMRVPARIGLLVTFALVVLAGYGLDELTRLLRLVRAERLKQKTGYIGALLLAFLVVATQVNWPLGLSEPVPAGAKVPAIYRWLAGRQDKVVLELPSISVDNEAFTNWDVDARYIYFSTYHWNRLINGYSGYAPPEYAQVFKELDGWPTKEDADLLRRLGVDYVIYHTGGDSKLRSGLINRASRLAADLDVRRFENDLLFSLKGKAPSSEPEAILTAQIRGPKRAASGGVVNIAVKVVNKSDRRRVVLPNRQPVAKYKWDGGNWKPVFLRLPLILEPGRPVWVKARVAAASDPGFRKLNLSVKSPLWRRRRHVLNVRLVDGLASSIKGGRGLSGKIARVKSARQVRPVRPFPLHLRLLNNGRVSWAAKHDPVTVILPPFDRGEVHVAAIWLDRRGRRRGEPQLFALPHDVGPGEALNYDVPVVPPAKQGKYRLKVDMVSLGKGWFSDSGLKTRSRTVVVGNGRPGRSEEETGARAK